MAIGFAHNVVIAPLLALTLTGLAKVSERWADRVKFCAFLGLLVMVGGVSAAIGWHHSLAWTLANAIYVFVLLTLAGLVLARFVTPKEPAPAGGWLPSPPRR